MVPAFVEKPEQKEIDRFDQPPEMTAQLREVVEPDVFLTGEANLLVEGEDKRDAKENAITRAASVLAHIAFVVFLVFLPKIFPPHVPTQSEIELASKELGVVYLPPDAGKLSRSPSPPPGPVVKISPKVLNKVAPPRPEEHAIEAPPARNPERPPSDLPAAPTAAAQSDAASAYRCHAACGLRAVAITPSARRSAADPGPFESRIVERLAREGNAGRTAGCGQARREWNV